MKLKPMKAAAVLFILTAMTSNIVCGTFAKYTTSASATDSARIAKWGVEVFSEGNLFGENYAGGPTNTVTTNDDGSITVKSYQTAVLGSGSETGNIVAPGTKSGSGLHFGFSGTPETAVRFDVTIKNQNIALRPGVYYFMYKVKDTVTAKNFNSLVQHYGTLYYKSAENTYSPADADTTGQLYYIKQSEECNMIFPDKPDSSDPSQRYHNWPYCPVVFELNPASGTGMTVNKTYNSASPAGKLPISFKDKSLDMICYSAMWCGFNGGYTWPTMDGNDVFERSTKLSSSRVFPANTDLTKTMLNGSAAYSMTDEYLTWEWDYTRDENTELYNMADSVLGRLAAEKLAKSSGTPIDDGFVVMRERNALGAVNGYFRGLTGSDTLVVPEEYQDYCLETMFDLEITVTQVD